LGQEKSANPGENIWQPYSSWLLRVRVLNKAWIWLVGMWKQHVLRPGSGLGLSSKFRLGLLLNKPKARARLYLGFGLGPRAWLFCVFSKSLRPSPILLNKLQGPETPEPKV
jgi:hypothetical protein